MSFGVSITDLKEAISLTWGLYNSLKDAPQEIKDLAKDLATVYGVINQIQDDLNATKSNILAHGEDRLKMLQSMTQGLNVTLREVQDVVDKFRPMTEVPKSERLWMKLKWVVSQKRIKRVRQDLSFHISAFTLLMTSMGNSSLRRIEEGLSDMHLTATEKLTDNLLETWPTVKSEPDGFCEKSVTSVWSIDACESETPESVNMPSTKVPEWLSPSRCLPSPAFRSMVEQMDSFQSRCLGDAVITNCQAACFHFYQTNALWRTRYSDSGEGLFEVEGFNCLRSPDTYQDFGLPVWLAKIRHALSARLNKPDSVTSDSIYDWPGYYADGSSFLMIPSIISPWGHIDIGQYEEGLLNAIRLCRHLQAWDSFGRLKGLWNDLHQWNDRKDANPSQPLSFNKWMQPEDWPPKWNQLTF